MTESTEQERDQQTPDATSRAEARSAYRRGMDALQKAVATLATGDALPDRLEEALAQLNGYIGDPAPLFPDAAFQHRFANLCAHLGTPKSGQADAAMTIACELVAMAFDACDRYWDGDGT